MTEKYKMGEELKDNEAWDSFPEEQNKIGEELKNNDIEVLNCLHEEIQATENKNTSADETTGNGDPSPAIDNEQKTKSLQQNTESLQQNTESVQHKTESLQQKTESLHQKIESPQHKTKSLHQKMVPHQINSSENKGAIDDCFKLENIEKAPQPLQKDAHFPSNSLSKHGEIQMSKEAEKEGIGKEEKEKADKGNEENKKVGKPTEFNLLDEIKVNRKLLPIKIAMFCFHGGSFSFLPYITLHMKQLGITNEEIGYIYAILPIPSILGPLISGVVADKLNAFKKVFLLNLILMIILHTMLLYVPPVPSGLGVDFECVAGAARLWTHGYSPHEIKLKNCRSTCDKIPLSQQFCFKSDGRIDCNLTEVGKELEFSGNVILDEKWKTLIKREMLSNSFAARFVKPMRYNVSYSGATRSYDSLMCGLDCPCAQACTVRCATQNLADDFKPLDSQYGKTFWVYLALRVPAQFLLASAFTMMDAVTMAVIANEGGDFGKQRLMSMISLGTIPLLSAYLVDYISAGGPPDYSIAFYVGDCLLLVSIAVTMLMNLGRPEGSSGSVWRDLRILMKKPEVIVFMFAIIVLGSNWGFLEAFFFVFLKELNAPTSLLGWTLTFGCAIGVPVMFAADRIIEKVGRSNIFILSFVAYSVRMFGYSAITNPWYSFPFEGLEIITYQLMWVAACTNFPILAPPSLLATMSGAAGTLHYNGGRAVGASVGGKLIAAFGARTTFRVFGVVSLVGGVLYVLLQLCWLRGPNKSKNEDGSNSHGGPIDLSNC